MPFPVDLQYITAAEQQLGKSFSPLFKTKMQQANGGLLWLDDEGGICPFFDQSDTKRIKRACNYILNETKTHRGEMVGDDVYFPPQAVLVAQNTTGTNLFCCLKTMCIGRGGVSVGP